MFQNYFSLFYFFLKSHPIPINSGDSVAFFSSVWQNWVLGKEMRKETAENLKTLSHLSDSKDNLMPLPSLNHEKAGQSKLKSTEAQAYDEYVKSRSDVHGKCCPSTLHGSR